MQSQSSTRPFYLNRVTVAFFFLLICAFSGWQMLKLPLWGWWPLLFNISLWLTGVMLFFPKDANKKKWLGAATLSGVLLGLGFPPSPLTFVVIFAFIPLLAVENGIYQREDRIRPGQVFLFSIHAFVLWNVIATFWVTNTAFVAGMFANFVNAALMAGVMVLIHIFNRKFPARLFTIIFLSFWIGFEYLHHVWDTSWPWLTLGNSMAEYPWAIQWYEFTGIFGGSLWILGLNLLGYSMIIRWLRAKPLKVHVYALILTLPLILSIWLWINTKPSDADPVPVVIVQPNFEPHFEKFDIPQTQQALRFLNLSRDILDSNDFYLVFPETSFESIQLNKFRENNVINIFQKLIDQYPHVHLVAGLSSYRILTVEEFEGSNVRIHKGSDGNDIHWDIQNSAVQMTSGMQSFQVYFKSKFVPGPEIFPYKEYLFFLRPVVEKLGGSYEGHTSQKERSVFTGGPLNVAPIICYESVYGHYTGEYVRKGATAFFIITNDGWWDLTPGHIQHLKIGALRAIEHRRPIARSANTGISCFIDIKGRIIQPTKYGVATAIRGEVIPETRLTFYSKYGDIIAISASIISIIILLAGIAMMIRKRLNR